MKLTFLGHQGWGVAVGDDGIVLVDPLRQAMGNGLVRLPVWPPRQLVFDDGPRVAGLVLTHEHSDHFDLDTLCRLPYRGDVWIPSLSSRAMSAALTEMGYVVRRMEAFQPFNPAPGLTFYPLATEHNQLERDVLGLLFRDALDHSFLTTVDGLPHSSLDEWLREHCRRRSADNFTNNAIELLPHLSNDPDTRHLSLGRSAAHLIEFVERFRPAHVILSGQGWHHSGGKAHLNHAFFLVTNDQLAALGRLLYPETVWSVPRPGQQFDLAQPHRDLEHAPFVQLLPPVARDFRADQTRGETPGPWSGIETLSPEEFARVDGFIQDDYGQVLAAHAGRLMAGLYELQMQPALPYTATMLLRVRNGGEAFDYALDYGALRFEPAVVEGNPARKFAVGLELWASDLLTLIDADEEAFLIYESSVRRWNNVPELFVESIAIEAFAWFAPRFRPREFLAAYRRRLRGMDRASSLKPPGES